MRKEFVNTLCNLAYKESNIILLSGDLGFMVLEPFIEQFPNRFINVGVAEQNMVGIATGLAESGFIPFVYSIAPFAVMRPYEFIRNGPVMHNLPVRIVGVGGGFEYGTAGFSHYALEDLSIMRVQPSISVIAPADSKQMHSALKNTWSLPNPIYYRVGKNDNLEVPGLNGNFSLEKLQIIRNGKDILIITIGSIAAEVALSAVLLAKDNIDSTIAVLSNFNPMPREDMVNLLSQFHIVLTVEEHYCNGGLGSSVSEVIAEEGLSCRLRRCGVKSVPSGSSGSRSSMLKINGLDRESLAQQVLKWVAISNG